MRLKVKFNEESSFKTTFQQNEQIFHPVIGEITVVSGLNYEDLNNKPSINGVELVGALTGEDLHLGDAAFPSGGSAGDLLGKTGEGVGWITPANAMEQDNTKPITAAAVYATVGNIQQLLQLI